VGELLEDRLVGRVLAALALAAALVAHLVEQHLAELLGAADRELDAAAVPHLALDAGDFLAELLRQPGKGLSVDLDAVPLHLRDDRDQRPVDAFVDARSAFEWQAGL